MMYLLNDEPHPSITCCKHLVLKDMGISVHLFLSTELTNSIHKLHVYISEKITLVKFT